MGSAWVLAARWVVGPEGSSLLTEGLLEVGCPCPMSCVHGLSLVCWPVLLGRGRIRKDSGNPRCRSWLGRPALGRAVRRWELGRGPLDVTVHGAQESVGPASCSPTQLCSPG